MKDTFFFAKLLFMEIKKASVLGFCFGVRRAVEIAEQALENTDNKKVYSLGPLIHNETVLKKLNSKGLEILDENKINDIEEKSVVIIRAHGVSPEVINKLRSKDCTVIDATCPRVKASQKMVQQYTSNNDYVILTGDRNHGEVIGIAGYAGKNFIQIQDKSEAEKIQIENSEKININLLSQTTYSMTEFEQIRNIITAKFKNVNVMNTICPATKERQDALLDLCNEVDGIIVIGGKNSANTKRLYQRAMENCRKAVHIESAEEIPEDFYLLRKVGITAGASTPDEIIDDVCKSLLNPS